MTISANVLEPLVSVIIPTYNRLDYLKEALQSAVQQTYQNLEIIVSDDAGNSENHTVATSFNDPRIRYRRNETNLGILGNNLAAFRETQGKYVVDLNDDDAWEPHFLSTLVPYLEADPDLVVAFADHWIMDEHSIVQPEMTEENTHRWYRDRITPGIHKPFYQISLVYKSVPMVMAAVIRRDAIEWDDFPAETGPVYDYWLNYLACRTGRGAYYHPERLTRYRVHLGSETSTGRMRVHRGQIYCYGRFLQDNRLKELRSHFRREYGLAHLNLASALIQTGQNIEARSYLLQGILNAPSLRAGMIGLLTFFPQAWLQNALHLKEFLTTSVEKQVIKT